MIKRQIMRVQGLMRHPPALSAAVQAVAQQRATQPGQVHPNLVCAPSQQAAAQQRDVGRSVQNLDLGLRGLAAAANGHAQTISGVAPYGLVDVETLPRRCRACSYGEVDAAHLARRQLRHQPMHGAARLGHHHQAAGVLVQAVDYACARQVSRLRAALQQTVEQGSRPIARTGVNHQPHRLVDHQHVRVFKNHRKIKRLGTKRRRRRRGHQLQRHHRTCGQLERRLSNHAIVDPNVAVLNQLRQVRARHLGHPLGQGAIQPLAVLRRLGLKNALPSLGQTGIACIVITHGLGVYNFLLHRQHPSLPDQRRPTQETMPKLSALCLSLAALLAGCASEATRDETLGWSPKRIYQEALDERDSGNTDKAVRLLERLEGRAAGTPLAQQAMLDAAYLHYKAREPVQAIATLDRFMRQHPSSAATDYALYLKGLANFNDDAGLLGFLTPRDLSERDQKAAKDAYETLRELTTRFPNSKYAADARARMAYVVNSLAQSEVNVALYYLSRGAPLAAVARAQTAIQDYPSAPALEEALAILVAAYDALQLPQLRDDNRRVLALNFPNSGYLRNGIKATDKSWWSLW